MHDGIKVVSNTIITPNIRYIRRNKAVQTRDNSDVNVIDKMSSKSSVIS